MAFTILSKDEMWNLTEKSANILSEKGVTEDQIKAMSQKDMALITGISEVGQIPERFSMFDGHDFSEEDTYDYFRTVVLFHFAVISKKK